MEAKKEDRTPSELSKEEIILIKRLGWRAARKYKSLVGYRYEVQELAQQAIFHVLNNLKYVPKPLIKKGAYIYKMQCYSILKMTMERKRPDNFTYYEVKDDEEIFSYYYDDKTELKREVEETLKKTLSKFTGVERQILEKRYVYNKTAIETEKETGKKWQSCAKLIRRFKLAFIEEWEKNDRRF